MVPVESAPLHEVSSPGMFARWQRAAEHVPPYQREIAALDRLAARARHLDQTAERLRRWGIGIAHARRLDRQAQRLDVERLTREMAAEAKYRATLFDVGDTTAPTWRALQRTLLCLGASTLWDIVATGEAEHEKSSAETRMTRRRSGVTCAPLPTLRPDLDVPRLRNANGPDLWLYPDVLALGGGTARPALLRLSDIQLRADAVRFAETMLPDDARVVEQTWRYVNADGGPDRRFADNPEIDVTLYGRLHFTSASGLNEAFLTTDAAGAVVVGEAWAAHRAAQP